MTVVLRYRPVHHVGAGVHHHDGIISRFIQRRIKLRAPMEAERINALAARLSDLERRSLELRRYL
jgi:hypothetical protein